MGVLLQDHDIAHIRSLYPYLNLRPLTSQQEQALMFYVKGYSVTAAAREAGYKDAAPLRALINSDEGKAILGYFQEKMFDSINITRELVTSLLLEAHSKAANATEEIAALRELGKLHDLYADQVENRKARQKEGITINLGGRTSRKQLERMSEGELIELAGDKYKHLLPEPEPLDVTQDPDYDKNLDV